MELAGVVVAPAVAPVPTDQYFTVTEPASCFCAKVITPALVTWFEAPVVTVQPPVVLATSFLAYGVAPPQVTSEVPWLPAAPGLAV